MMRPTCSLFAAFAVILIGLHAGPAYAVNPDEMLSDPVLEERARDISQELRCLVCQNQSIDDSDADLARDLRILVRERLIASDTNDEVIDYIVERYGDYVLLNPPLKPETYILWISPILLALFALIAVIAFYRRKQREDGAGPKSLSDQEEKRLTEILGSSQDRS
ncbi:cytochrome c-type biogenesis protein [Thalassospira alkalitolerans]|uniref:Cytochrome c-type biogenesis protein n=1 Tax=Thalassospira alkalitolerans TaxID=1293890 RepID=A0A1Y2L7D9_9PROT|nr:cytochrome c-type biogenesis protein [Thalassospira alkalitolerans]OSQ44385.1 cytochrome C biogenesis protein CcmH [Thalassospira alkalitolerans]|tara:strand:+ start:13753 stop:14247 length:495 start_codon:yes stop_codon:yes gene_type:complete